MSEKVQYAIEIVDRWGQPMKKFKSGIDRINRTKVKDPFRNTPRSLDRLRGNLERYKRAAATTFRGDHLRKYNVLIGKTEKKLQMLGGASKSASAKTNMLGGAMGMLSAVGAVAAIGAITAATIRFGKESLLASAKFETYATTLKTMLGSKGAARERMQEYTNIAGKTPFALRQVVEAGNMLQAIGRYSKDNITMLGDLAAASGKPIEQVMNAFAKLSTGQKGEGVNMFRDLLISSTDWAEATGKGIKKNGELAATTEEMITALPKILRKKGFFGMMDQQSKTTTGRISNLSDTFDMLKVAVGDNMKPAFDKFLVGSSGILENMIKRVELSVPEKIAREKVELNTLVGVITNANTENQVRYDLLKNLQQQYPEFLKGIDWETIKNEELRQKLAEVNAEYDKKLRLTSMQTMYERSEETVETIKKRLSEARLALDAKKKIERTRGGVESILKIEGLENREASNVNDIVSRSIKRYYNKDNPQSYSTEDILKLTEWSANYEMYAEFDSKWSSPLHEIKKLTKELTAAENKKAVYENIMAQESRKILLEKARGINIDEKTRFDELFGKKEVSKDFDTLRKKSFETINTDEWQKLQDYVDGKLKYTLSPNPSPNPINGLNINKAQATIDGGGRMVKQVTVNIDNLIGNNTNMFRDTDSVQDAESFLNKLSTALQLVVNDVNYAAG
jgi:hypothetical protein